MVNEVEQRGGKGVPKGKQGCHGVRNKKRKRKCCDQEENGKWKKSEDHKLENRKRWMLCWKLWSKGVRRCDAIQKVKSPNDMREDGEQQGHSASETNAKCSREVRTEEDFDCLQEKWFNIERKSSG